MNHINSWKSSKKIFYDQLNLNMKEFTVGPAPKHWKTFVEFVKRTKPKRIHDIGCGAGIYSEICKYTEGNYSINEKHDVEYVGYDYADAAIEVAEEAWLKRKGSNCSFHVKSYQEFTKNDIKEGDCIVANGLVTVMQDGDKCTEHLMSLQCKNLLIQRQVLHDGDNHCTTYEVYGNNTTYNYKMSRTFLKTLTRKYNYDVELIELYDSQKNNGDFDRIYDIVLELRD